MKQVDKLKVLFISGLDGDTRRYRCFHQQEQLASQGVVTGFCESDDPQSLVDVLTYDVLVLHRVPYSRLIGNVIDLAHLRGKPVIFETDDLVFDPQLYDHIGFVDTLSVEDARKYRQDIEAQVETFQRCDCVLTSTEYLASEVRRRGKPAYINRNAPSSEMIRISELALAHRRQRLEQGDNEDQSVEMAYFSGTGSHNRDFRVITEPLIWALETYPQTWLHVSGHLDLGPEFSPFRQRIRRAPFISWRELPYLIAQADINLSPLEQDNPFCRAKSENKFVEAALVGVPTVASRMEAFEYTITSGENGLLAGSTDEWAAALTLLITDPERRRTMGEAARQTVYASYLPEQRGQELLSTMQTIVQAHSTPAVRAEQVIYELAQWMKQLLDDQSAIHHQQEQQLLDLRQTMDQWETNLQTIRRQYEKQLEHLQQTLIQRETDLREAERRHAQTLQAVLEQLQKSRLSSTSTGLINNLGER